MILIQTCYYCSTRRKLVGVRFFSQGSDALFSSARDTDGHGSHTLSTAGGNFVDGVNVFGNGNGLMALPKEDLQRHMLQPTRCVGR